MSVTFTDNDKVYRRMLKQLHAGQSYTKVGVQQGTERKDETGQTSKMVVVAAVQEFGAPTRHIPERPFMRKTFDVNKEKLAQMQATLYSKVLAGKMTTKRGLAILGQFMEDETKKVIEAWTLPPNAPSTQRAKGRKTGIEGAMIDNPLQDTNQMLQSIRHVEVVV